jgi:hypothetical protein
MPFRVRVNPPDGLDQTSPAERMLDVQSPLRSVNSQLHKSLLGYLPRSDLFREIPLRLGRQRKAATREMTEHSFLAVIVAGIATYKVSIAQRAQDGDEIRNSVNRAQTQRRSGCGCGRVAPCPFSLQHSGATAFDQQAQGGIFFQQLLAFAAGQEIELSEAT